MDRIKIFLLLLVFYGCQQKSRFISDNYNIIIYVNPYLFVNLKDKTVNVDFGKMQYKDSLIILNSERIDIEQAFFSTHMNDLRGEKFYSVDLPTLPANDFRLKIFQGNTKVSEVFISYQLTQDNSSSDLALKASFRDQVLKVLTKNKQYQKAMDSLTTYQKEIGFFML